MSFQRVFVPCQLYAPARTHTHILQLILQPENLFKHFSEGLGIETGDKALKGESKGVTTAHYCGSVETAALSS